MLHFYVNVVKLAYIKRTNLVINGHTLQFRLVLLTLLCCGNRSDDFSQPVPVDLFNILPDPPLKACLKKEEKVFILPVRLKEFPHFSSQNQAGIDPFLLKTCIIHLLFI